MVAIVFLDFGGMEGGEGVTQFFVWKEKRDESVD